ncbi:titin isoform X1 [Danaus plexippus]|uniref:titin isoform X1 n=1 Tax=Danaus plexippus TaxID=13037 RepID=UPI002AAF9FFD|nr:titin isoform X1 [Danaus plexippus]XP_061383016.1 titin isoform X1 [Danaus plexippus]XP_061383017.1 titin isoform X1 [Danaus plexippus]XP_061383018.1 titin isoform X1 [Danaus plexippus]XP_061383019.1 titin isoform X1 [Danaus plexippus]
MALLVLMIACLSALAHAQSNYGSQANNIEYQGDGLPEQTVLDGKVTKLDDLSPVIFLNRTKATLNCEAGSMQIELKFNEKFYGIAYADFDRHSACQVSGKGATSYKLELPLKGCGTKQDPLRVFTNNIVVRFHPGLEMDGDEVITIVCRYPPPIVPVFKPLIYTPEAKGPLPAKAPLAGTHILLIICAILFLTLLLLGLGVSYLCLNRRTLPAPRRLIDDSSASIISRESIQEVKIPRAHPVYPAAAESASVASDTLPSDYPSETPSEADHAHANQAFMIDDYQSEGYGESHETSLTHSRLTGAAPPAFDVRVRVQRPPAPPSPVSTITTTEVDGGSIRQQTLVEEHERQESVRTVSPGALPLPARAVHASPPERPPRPPALYTEVHRERQEWSRRPRSIASLNTEMTDTHSVTEVTDRSHARMFHIKKPPPPPPVMTERLETEEQEMLMESLEPIPETPIMPARKPEITSHVVDDVFLRTITEKKTIEDIERHKRLVTEYRQVPHVPQFDVTIRNHTQPEAQWENFSDISSASGMTLTPKMERVPLSLPPQKFIGKGGPDLFSPELIKQTDAVYSPSSPDLPLLPELPPARNPLYREEDDEDVPEPIPSPPVPQNWSVLTRVLKTEAQDEVLSESERVHRLTREERLRWRELITHESTLRRELASSSSRDDFTRVSRDHRYAPLYTPPKWEVIIRILAPPPDKPKNRYRKKSEWESRSRRSSLPTLYEYDSDATSLREPQRSRRSSYRSDHVDMRSMSEMMVDYAREQADTHSEVSAGTLLGRYYDDDSDSEHHYNQHPSWRNSLHRSVSQPSLARSATELTERWTAPDGDVTPTPPRRNRGLIGGQGMTAFTSSEVRTFQASREWRE